MYYATRTQAITAGRNEHQLLKFHTRRERDQFCYADGARPIVAKEAHRLMLINIWHTRTGNGVLFYQTTYLPE